MAEVWNMPIKERPSFFARLVRAVLLILVVLARVRSWPRRSLASVATLDPESPIVTVADGHPHAWRSTWRLYLARVSVMLSAEVASTPVTSGSGCRGGRRAVDRAADARELAGRPPVAATPASSTASSASSSGCLFFLYLASQIIVYAAEVNVVAAAPSLAPQRALHHR